MPSPYPYSVAGCAVSGSNCVCTFVFNGHALYAAAGTYSQAGSTAINFIPSELNAPPEIDSYCVQGNTLYFQANNSAFLGLRGALVLSRQ